MKFLITILSSFFCLSLTAHQGRTDKNGGHYDRSNGSYHYHAVPQIEADMLRNKSEANNGAKISKATVKSEKKATEKVAG